MNFVRKRLRRASFGGQWFYLNDTNIESGRRVSRFEFPFQHAPIVQDLGKQGQIISIAGFVAGANYRSNAENLMKVCEKEGPTELFHPYYGRRQVVCKSCRVNENNIEGGIIYFFFQFYETIDTKAGAFGLQNMPLVGAIGGAETLAEASRVINESIDYANNVVGYVDQLNDSILTMTEQFEKVFSPILHAQDSINNLALALNDMRRSVSQDIYIGTEGIKHAFENVRNVIAGGTIDDTDPYHWTHEFPPQRIYPFYPFWPILLGTKAFVVGMQGNHVFSTLKNHSPSRQVKELRALKANIDSMIEEAQSKPDLYRKLKDLDSTVVTMLFSEPLSLVSDDEEKAPAKCLILEAYEERGGLDAIDKIIDQYRYSNTLLL